MCSWEQGTYAVAEWDFTAESDMELELKEGDVVRVKQKSGEWRWGENYSSRKSGYFPENFVKEYQI